MNFLILALPRSRTMWLANFLTTDKTLCYHDALSTCSSFNEILDLKSDRLLGDSDSGLAWFPERINSLNVRKVIIRRSLDEVVESLTHVGMDGRGMKELERRLNTIKADLVIDFDQINDRLEDIWNCCTELPFDHERAELLKNMNVQVNHIKFHPDKLASLIKEIACQSVLV